MQGLTLGLRDFLVPDFLIFAEVEGHPAGVVYAVPDLNQDANSIDHGCLLIIGVREEFRGRGINLGMAAKELPCNDRTRLSNGELYGRA